MVQGPQLAVPGSRGLLPPAAGTGGPRARPLRAASRVSVGAVVVVLGVQLAAPATWVQLPWVPFAVGLLAGLPHGALDHLVPWWTGTPRRPGRLVGLLGAYVVLAIATFVVARAFPAPALVALLGASVVHFGTGETVVADLRAGRRGPPLRWPGAGAAVVVGPFVAWPGTVRPVLDVLAPGSADVLLDPRVLLVAGTASALAVGVTVVMQVAAGRGRDAAELLLLVALVVLVPPLPAFGIFFGAWHGLRHLARLVALDPASAADLDAGRSARPWARIGLRASLPTGAVLAALAVLMAVPGLFPIAVAGLESAGLALVLALTVPHMTVVAVLDRRQRGDGQHDGRPPVAGSVTDRAGEDASRP